MNDSSNSSVSIFFNLMRRFFADDFFSLTFYNHIYMKHIILFILSFIFFTYFIVLQMINPALISFSTVWFMTAAVLFFIAYRIKKNRPFKKWQKISATVSMLILVIIVSTILPQILTPAINDGKIETEYVVILGGGIKQNGTITQMPRERLVSAAEFLKAHPESKAVVTGGKLPFVNHAEAPELAKELIKLGISAERILIEDQAQDTIENFKYSARLIAEDKGCSLKEVLDMPITVVTSSFHLNRAEILARRIGFKKVYGISAHVPAVFALNVYSREICAYIKLGLRIILTGKPSEI